MKVFNLDFTDDVVRAIADHGEREYPNEAVGLGLGKLGAPALDRVVPMKNVQDKYHALDPEQFPRTSRDAFRLDELERMKLLDANNGLAERVLYHSHPDAGAYFSPEDRANAVHQGMELMPGAVHVVVSVREGRAVDMAAFRYDVEREIFHEQRIDMQATDGLPDLELRSMEGREAARPIRPVGPGLGLRRLTRLESARLPLLAEGRKIEINAEQLLDLSCLGRGLFSPLTGFMRSADVVSVDLKGRLQGGTPWRTPVRLQVARRDVPPLSAGSVVELATTEGKTVGLMAVVSMETVKDRVFLGGPVYVYTEVDGPDAAESRAQLVRIGARRVLAVPPEQLESARKMDLSEFDAVLATERLEGAVLLPLVASHRGPWMQAVMAQNLGATHFLTTDGGLRKQLEDTLAIEPWHPA